jgi:glycosyltransferase involved in cell wall biosynthesis
MMDTAPRRPAVLMVAYTYYESDPRVIREAEAARDAGFEVDFLALRRPGTAPTETVRGVHLLRLNQAKHRGGGIAKYLLEYFRFFLRCCLKITALFWQRRYAVIHVNNMPDFLVFSALIPRLFGAKVILDIHDPMPNTFVSKFKGGEGGLYYRLLIWQERLSAAFCSRVVTVHDLVKTEILVRHGVRPESIAVVANFADQDLFPLRTSFRADGTIRCAFHGTILERAGLRTLLTALAHVRHADRISVKIIGEGDFSPTLRDLIRSLKLERMVEFDNCSYPADSIPARLGDCNVGLVPLDLTAPITNLALPIKLLEYIAMGLPVVAIRNAAIAHYFGEEDCLFFDWNDPASLSAALDRLAESPDLLLRYRARAMALRERFAWTAEKQKYTALLRELAGTAAPDLSVIPHAPTLPDPVQAGHAAGRAAGGRRQAA